MRKEYGYYVDEFIGGLLEQQRGILEGLGRPYVRKQEQRYTRAAQKLRESEEGVAVFAQLLAHDVPHVALTAAVCLLETSAERRAVEALEEYAKGPEEDFDAACARLRLREWQKERTQQR